MSQSRISRVQRERLDEAFADGEADAYNGREPRHVSRNLKAAYDKGRRAGRTRRARWLRWRVTTNTERIMQASDEASPAEYQAARRRAMCARRAWLRAWHQADISDRWTNQRVREVADAEAFTARPHDFLEWSPL